MAKAVRVHSDNRDVQLTLTVQEAEVLLFVTKRIGGMPEMTPRGHMDQIGYALSEAGVESHEFQCDSIRNSIYFENK